MWKYSIVNRYCISCKYSWEDQLHGGVYDGLYVLSCSRFTNNGWGKHVYKWWSVDIPDEIYQFTSSMCPLRGNGRCGNT